MSGLGVVIRNDNGSVLASCSKKISQAYKSDEIETMATTTTLSFVHKLGFKHAILEGDSLVLINALKTEVHSLAPMGLLIEDVKMLSQNFDKLLYSHTKRNSNFVAHHNLAKYTIGIPNFLVCGWKISYHTSFLFYNLIRLIYIKKISKVFTQKNKNKKTRPIILYHALFL